MLNIFDDFLTLLIVIICFFNYLYKKIIINNNMFNLSKFIYGENENKMEEVHFNNTLRILTLNIWWGNYGMNNERLQKQIRYVKNLNCDIICLQEVFDIDCQRQYQNELSEYTMFSSGIIEHRWLRYVSCFCLNGIRRVIDGDTLGLVIFVKKDLKPKYRLTKKFRHQAIPDRILTKLVEKNFSKGFLSVSIQIDNKTINITNFHLNTGDYDEEPHRRGGYNYNRIYQLKEMIDNSGDMLIFCGDTNSDIDTQPECKWMLGAGGCVDTYSSCHKEDEGFTWSDDNPYTQGWLISENQRIDAILLNNNMADNCEILNSTVVFDDDVVSDHYGVLTVINV